MQRRKGTLEKSQNSNTPTDTDHSSQESSPYHPAPFHHSRQLTASREFSYGAVSYILTREIPRIRSIAIFARADSPPIGAKPRAILLWSRAEESLDTLRVQIRVPPVSFYLFTRQNKITESIVSWNPHHHNPKLRPSPQAYAHFQNLGI
jgi:hypothetical protein